MKNFAISGIHCDMGYVLAVRPAAAGEEQQITDPQVRFADVGTDFGLGDRGAWQIYAVFLKIYCVNDEQSK